MGAIGLGVGDKVGVNWFAGGPPIPFNLVVAVGVIAVCVPGGLAVEFVGLEAVEV